MLRNFLALRIAAGIPICCFLISLVFPAAAETEFFKYRFLTTTGDHKFGGKLKIGNLERWNFYRVKFDSLGRVERFKNQKYGKLLNWNSYTYVGSQNYPYEIR